MNIYDSIIESIKSSGATLAKNSPWAILGLVLTIPVIMMVPDRGVLLMWYVGKATIAYFIAKQIDANSAKPADAIVTIVEAGEAPDITQARERNRQFALIRRAITIGFLQIAFGLAP